MAKKIILELTRTQFLALIDVTDTLSAMVGVGDPDFDIGVKRNVKNLDAMLKKNGFKRTYN